jgi:uncharacterized protein YjbI with pentapeptide repeats
LKNHVQWKRSVQFQCCHHWLIQCNASEASKLLGLLAAQPSSQPLDERAARLLAAIQSKNTPVNDLDLTHAVRLAELAQQSSDMNLPRLRELANAHALMQTTRPLRDQRPEPNVVLHITRDKRMTPEPRPPRPAPGEPITQIAAYLEPGLGGQVLNLAEADLRTIPNLVDQINRLQSGSQKVFLDFRNANLSGINLQGVDLSGANLNGANLSNSILVDANFGVANLRGANLSGANLSRARLLGLAEGADLRGANLTGAQLDGAALNGANLSNALLREASLYEADLQRADLTNSNLTSAYLAKAQLAGALLEGSTLNQANLYRADLRGARLGRTNLVGANMTETNLQNADLRAADLTQANLSNADLRGANLTQTLLDRAILPK